ncbi:MAG: TPM domain-containing protein [Bacillota bacterium]
MVRFSQQDRERITAAIHTAEKRTSGEFVAMVAGASDSYLSFALLWAAGLVFLLPAPFLLFAAPVRYLHIYQLQLLAFIALTLLFEFLPALHMALVPKHVKHARASRLAHAQFYERGVHVTREHSGVLFFVSLAEHYVEIVADKGIHEKVGEGAWGRIVKLFVDEVQKGDVTSGFVSAIEACGDAMARHYPTTPDDQDELSDGLIEI